MMTIEQLATLLDRSEYPFRPSNEIQQQAKAAGLVIVTGGSDDLMEFKGAINDEVGAYDGGTAYVDAKGLLPDRENIDDDDKLADYFARKPAAKPIEALWDAEEGYCWTYETEIPHVTFELLDDGETWCRGIVFRLADAGAAP